MSWLILSGQINLKAVCVVDEEQFCVFISKNMFWQKCCGKEVEDGMWDQTPRILVRKICHSCMRRTQTKVALVRATCLEITFFSFVFELWICGQWDMQKKSHFDVLTSQIIAWKNIFTVAIVHIYQKSWRDHCIMGETTKSDSWRSGSVSKDKLNINWTSLTNQCVSIK